jgi:thiol-disulfide isomerase/thioredoxin
MRFLILSSLLLTLGCSRCSSTSQTSIAVGDPPAGPGAMAPRLYKGDRGEVLASWLEPRGEKHQLRYARLTRQGWSEPRVVVERAMIANWADTPGVIETEKGLVAHWLEKSGEAKYAYDVRLGRAAEGAELELLGAAHDDGTQTEHGFVSSVAEGDAVRIFWLDGRQMAEEPPGPMSLRTGLVGSGKSEVVDARVCDCCGTAAVRTPTGAAVAYRDRNEAEVRDISVAVSTPEGWRSTTVAKDEWVTKGCPVNGPALEGAGSALAIAWFTAAEDRARVKVAFSDDAGRSWSRPVEVAAPRDGVEPLGRVDLALLSPGDAVVTWVESEGQLAAIRARRVRAGQEPSAVSTLAWTLPARKSGFPRLARDGARLVLAWTEASTPSRVRARSFDVADIGRADLTPRAKTAPEAPYVARDLEGDALRLPKGERYVLAFWATWCAPCREELKELVDVHAETGVKIIAVSLDEASEADAVRALAAELKLPYVVGHDPDNSAASRFRVPAVPTTLIFDEAGREVFRRVGAWERDELKAALAKQGARAATQ